MSEINVKINDFEGPLDLLLHLIKQLEIDIYDIPIAEVTAQYLAYIHTMKELKLDVAGDYLVMAATLMAIKSRLLLPKQEMDREDAEADVYEDGEDPRDALVDQLIEYRKYKEAAFLLKSKEEERSQYYTKEPDNLEHLRENVLLEPLQISTFDLVVAFQEMLNKRLRKAPLKTTVTAEEITIGDKMELIKAKLQTLSEDEGFAFDVFFETSTRKEMVTTFLALLELIKEQSILIRQEFTYGKIMIYQANGTK